MILEVILLSLLSNRSIRAMEIPITTQVMEEISANKTFLSLQSRLRNFSVNIEEISFLSRNSLVHVSNDGDISFREKLDLESICTTRQMCCGVVVCVIDLYIPIKNIKTNSLTNGVKLELELIDINDNKPIFLKPRISISINELTNTGATFSLASAIDRDFSTINRIHKHAIIDPSKTFSLEIERLESKNLYLKLLKPLDYEIRKYYSVILQACDPEFCTNQTIDVQVKDENDNSPKFEKSLYNISIKETIGIGHVVVTVKAVDLDRSSNYSTIKYKMDSKTIDFNILSTFRVDELSGNIILQQQLNAKIRSKYSFQVIARDLEDGGNSDTSTIVIFIKDENNCAPIIDLLYPSNGYIAIVENQNPQQIAILSVTDNDLGINSHITCEIPIPSDNNNFILKSKSSNLFTIESLKQFDYEKDQSFSIQIRCRDFGFPALTTINSLKVSILDENEFSPMFIDLNYRNYVKENIRPQTRLMQIKVRDEDKNATLRFSVKNVTDFSLLKIDKETGWISSTENNIDRETIQEFSLIVVVKDTLGNDAKSVSTTVHFQVEDDNDNKPKFMEKFNFEISENVAVNTLVGRVWATDADEGGSSMLKYSLLKIWSSRQKEINNLFLIKSDGNIETQGEIDRELDDNFTLLIAVSDDNQSSDVVTSNVTILVSDENDNAPIWLVPNFDNAVFNITINYKIGDQVLQLVAKDADASINGVIQYVLTPNDIKNEKALKYFHVNSSTGGVFVVNHLSESSYELKLEAIDSGRPVLRTSTFLIIYVYGQESPILKIAVVASMISITGIISLFLIVAIICVRKHPNKRQTFSTEFNQNEIDDSLLKSKLTVNYVQQTPDFLRLLGNENSNSTLQIPMLSSSHRHINEYLDADSGDSGNGPSEEGLSSHYMADGKVFMRSMNQSGINYASSSFIPSGLYPHSCFSLPENATIPQFSDNMLEGNSYYNLSATGKRNFSGFLQKYPSILTTTNDYPMQDVYSQLSQI